jgi:hypothetical protein
MSKIYQKGREIFGDPVSIERGSKEDSSCDYLSFFRDRKQPDGTYDLTHLWETKDGEQDAMVRFCNMEERKWIDDAREEGIVSEARLIQLLAKAFRLKTRSIRHVSCDRLEQS